MLVSDPKVIVALDFDCPEKVRQFVSRIEPGSVRLKVGKELFTRVGPEIVQELIEKGFDIFLDLKFHDIPNTVAKAVQSAAELGVWMVNVHASGGARMMSAAREILEPYEKRPKLIAVTVLTSMEETELPELGIQRDLDSHVLSLATLTKNSGLDGVVCSARESIALKRALGDDFQLVTPGIRPAGASLDDQKRIVTPVQAIRDGVDYLVIGRPITKAEDPASVITSINQEIMSI
ncbi:orotidine-5'-phosphate decarboxylase [Algicola sagamiensis]|uniref:orotidine-5'-phosphate decarboxylase n=1 Tax=Algicola sagamiensis TaxID=163869 RepID=UPI000379AF4C|nr:orotidine-5'-phosphate decarboxylase [Algicola sagamiensis]